MTDKPEIKVGQRWITRDKGVVRIESTDGAHPWTITARADDGGLYAWQFDGRHLPPPAKSAYDLMELMQEPAP